MLLEWNILKVWKELSCTTSDGPLATIPDIPHAKALHTWTQLLQGRRESLSRRHTPFTCQLCEGGGEIDNPDQRLTADVSSMLASYELIMEADLFILPAATAYYAYKVNLEHFVDPQISTHPGLLCVNLDWSYWHVCPLSSILPKQVPHEPCCQEDGKTWRKVMGSDLVEERWWIQICWPPLVREGDFRYLHTNLREHAESVALQVCRMTTPLHCCLPVDSILLS